VVALLAVAAVLLCHGVLGASHLLAPVAHARHATTANAVHEATGHPESELSESGLPWSDPHATDQQGHGNVGTFSGTTNYFAVLVLAAGMLLLKACLPDFPLFPVRHAIRPLFRCRRLSDPKPSTGGLSPPLLQVFRL
jgi:hypothetical protein